MLINADFSERAINLAADAQWRPSPAAGVERRMLDRIGDEVAVATSVVRYAPGSRFPTHTHTRGEEFLVLEGVFSDTAGDYGPGFYVRNPPGTSHAPWTDHGTTILVKLRQFQATDRRRIAIDTSNGKWSPAANVGCTEQLLHSFEGEQVRMLHLDAGAQIPSRMIPGGEEIYVVSGAIEDAAGVYPHDSWIRNAPGTAESYRATEAAVLWVKAGHLEPVDGPDRAATWEALAEA